ncbi:MAG: ABC transporter transmembrane domain-containing protein [Chloroflexia bacterium]
MAVGIQHEDEILGKAYDKRIVRRLMGYISPYRKRVAVGVLLLLSTALVDLSGPYITKIAIDRYVLSGDSSGLLGMCALYMAILVVGFALLQTYVTGVLGQNVMFDLRTRMFAHVRGSRLFYDRNLGRRHGRRTTPTPPSR